ncbi:MAG: hypothetical protein Q7J34_09615 [Bacteroidales bacterium]|nr:hypothetical protein [Bacteroidales bacterium]
MKRLLIFLVSLGFIVQAISQNSNSGSLCPKVSLLFAPINIKNNEGQSVFNGADFAEEFENQWKTNSTQEIDKKATEVFDKMQQMRIRTYPDIYNYLRLLQRSVILNQTEAFIKTTNILTDNKSKIGYAKFFKAYEDLLNDSLLCTYKNIQWKAASINFEIKPENEPEFLFNNTDLICIISGTRYHIKEASGTYQLANQTWKGKGGILNWERQGLQPDSVFASLGKYDILMLNTEFIADSSFLTDLRISKTRLKGNLEENFRANKKSFPKFTTTGSTVYIKNFFPNIDYSGGIRIEAEKFYGVGKPGNKASIYFDSKSKAKVLVRSYEFLFNHKFISAKDASVTIRYEKDSVYHPNIGFTYDLDAQKVSLFQGQNMLSDIPFYDSYHQLEINTNSLQWAINDSMVYFMRSAGLVKEADANFISESYFRADFYNGLQGVDPVNPLMRLYQFVQANQSNKFYSKDYAYSQHQSPDQVRLSLINLASKGFLFYDRQQDLFTAKDKLFHFINSHLGKKDFDNLVIFSDSARINATLNLRNLDLQIFNSVQVILSDSQKVAITPYNYTLTVQQNRDIAYSGRAKAGTFDFFSTKRNYFLYDEFRLSLPEVDSIRMMVKERQKEEKQSRIRYVRIQSVIEKVAGDLQIDQPDNKSGRKSLRIPYPVFNTDSSHSYVYYDRGKFAKFYPRQSFYYKVKPFILSNLDNFELDSLDLKGQLFSGYIFPPIHQPLRIKKDFSLGIMHHTGTAGSPVYVGTGAGMGLFKGKIDLSHQGLRGDGELRFLNSICQTDTTRFLDSTDFVFFPDRATGLMESFKMDRTDKPIAYPKTYGKSILIEWKPYIENMALMTRKHPIELFGDKMKFSGTMFLNPNGLEGSGTGLFNNASLEAGHFAFDQKGFSSDSSELFIRTTDKKQISLQATGYKVKADFDKNEAVFDAAGKAGLRFPALKYVSDHSHFIWKTDSAHIYMKSRDFDRQFAEIQKIPGIEIPEKYSKGHIPGPRLLSLKNGQDSLQFISYETSFDINSARLIAKKVPFVKSADAYIINSGQSIEITNETRPLNFENAGLVIHNDSATHELYRVKAVINSSKKYTATGDIYYKRIVDKKNIIHLDNIEPDIMSGISQGSGKIKDSLYLRLSPYFGFYGDVHLTGNQQNLRFDGFYRMNAGNCRKSGILWIKADTIINPEKVIIPVKENSLSADYFKIGNGIFITRKTGEIHPMFLDPLTDAKEPAILSATGQLAFDPQSGEYRIGPAEKLFNRMKPGNMVSLDTLHCILRGEGKPEFYNQFSPTVKLDTYGDIEYHFKNDSVFADLMMVFDFPFTPEAAGVFIKDISEGFHPGVLAKKDEQKRKIYEWLGEKAGESFAFDVQSGVNKASEIVKLPLVLSNLKFIYDAENQIYHCYGPIGVMAFYGRIVNKLVPGYIQWIKKANLREDEIRIYLQYEDQGYYYFNYGRGSVMRLFSTNNDFITALLKERDKVNDKYEKEHNSKRWQPYKLSITSKTDPITFRAEMQTNKN